MDRVSEYREGNGDVHIYPRDVDRRYMREYEA